jgi:hypothetical protein
LRLRPGRQQAHPAERQCSSTSCPVKSQLGVDADCPECECVWSGLNKDGEYHPPICAFRATVDTTMGALVRWWSDPSPATIYRRGASRTSHKLVHVQNVAATRRLERDGALDNLAARPARGFRRRNGTGPDDQDSDHRCHHTPRLAHARPFLACCVRSPTTNGQAGQIVTCGRHAPPRRYAAAGPRHPPQARQLSAWPQPDRHRLDLYSRVTATMQQEAVRAFEGLSAVRKGYRRPEHQLRARSSVGQSSGLRTGWHQMDAGL